MGEARSQRVFFALWPDAAATARLAALAHGLAGGGRLMRPASLHLTLAFIGSVTPSQLTELARIAAAVRTPAFDLCLDRLGFFPRGGILWAGCARAPSRQRRLSDLLTGALREAGFAIDDRSGQVPHVTLARRMHGLALPSLEDPIRWRVREFALVESHLQPSAAYYTTLARFPLDDAEAD